MLKDKIPLCMRCRMMVLTEAFVYGLITTGGPSARWELSDRAWSTKTALGRGGTEILPTCVNWGWQAYMTSTVRDICRSLFSHSTFFVASLVFMKLVKSEAVYPRTVHIGNSSVPPRLSAVFVKWTRSLSFDFQIWYPHRWLTHDATAREADLSL